MPSQYAIRVSSRAQSNLKTQDVIKLIASLVGPRHKVDLTNPDKFILVEIFQVSVTRFFVCLSMLTFA